MFKRVLLVDGNHLIYRAYFKFKNLKTLDGKPTSILYGGPYILESLIRRLGPDLVRVVFDHSRSKFRTDLLPNYKKRDSKLGDDKEDFYSQRDELIELLTTLGLMVYQPKGYEADDVICYLTQKYYHENYEVVIVSGDKDFVQLIGNRVSMFNVNKGKMVDQDNCRKFYDFIPKHCVDFLSLCGDSSDKIPGYPGVGPKTADKLLSEYGSIKKYLKSDGVIKRIDKEKLKAIHDINYKLIDLMYFRRNQLVDDDMVPINPNPFINDKLLKAICRINQINSFTKVQFFKTFKNLYNGK